MSTSHTPQWLTPASYPETQGKSPAQRSDSPKLMVLSFPRRARSYKGHRRRFSPNMKPSARVMKSVQVSVSWFRKAKAALSMRAITRMQCSCLLWARCLPVFSVWEGSTMLTAFIFSMLWWIWNLHPAQDRINLLQHKSLDHFSFKCGKTALSMWKVESTS